MNNVAEAESEQYEGLCSITTESVNKVTKSLHRQCLQLCCSKTIWSNSRWIVGQRVTIIPISLVNPNVQIEETDQVLVMYNKSALKPMMKLSL